MFSRINRAAAGGCMAVCLFTASLFGQATGNDAHPRPAAGLLRVLIISGEGEHDWRATTPFLRRILADTGRFDVRVCETPAGLSARTLADFDVLVDDHAGAALGSDTEGAIARFVESGKGLVLTHAALGSRPGTHAPDDGKEPALPASGAGIRPCTF